MAGTYYSNSILKKESPQYAYALAILSGGIAFIVPQLGAPISAWLSYALLAALFASIWPYRALQWAGWLCLPILLLVCFDVVGSRSVSGFLNNVMIFSKVLSAACLGAYLGSKLSVRKIANRSAKRQFKRKRSKSSESRALNGLRLEELAAPIEGVETVFSNHDTIAPVQVHEQATYFNGINAALIKAAQEGDHESIELLIAKGADVNAESGDQWMPLTIAAQGFDVEMAKALFGQEAAFDDSGGKGCTALMIAIIEGHVEVVRALLEHGARVNARNNKGWTALRFAVSMDETEILRVLLDAGADANLADDEGKTALMQAAGENIRESLKALLDAGADARIKDHNEQTALKIAQKQGHTEIIKLLKDAEAKASTRIEVRARLLEAGNPEAADKTHRVIKVCCGQHYGEVARYDVIPTRAALPQDCEETGREGNEEECLDYAWKNNIEELEWRLGF
jgi:ankyrin repeat protein